MLSVCLVSLVMQPEPTYLAEKHGNLLRVIDAYAAQQKYLEAYVPAVDAFSAEDNFEAMQWYTRAGLVGKEMAHFHPFRSDLLRSCKLAQFADVDEFAQRFGRFPLVNTMREGGALASKDGLVRSAVLLALCTSAPLTARSITFAAPCRRSDG